MWPKKKGEKIQAEKEDAKTITPPREKSGIRKKLEEVGTAMEKGIYNPSPDNHDQFNVATGLLNAESADQIIDSIDRLITSNDENTKINKDAVFWSKRLTIALILVTLVTGLINAGVIWSTAQTASKISEKQLLPQFSISRIQTSSSSENLVIQNQGGLCYDFNPEVITFLQVGITKNSSTANYLIPLDDYFDWKLGLNQGGCNLTMSDQPQTPPYPTYTDIDNLRLANELQSSLMMTSIKSGELAYAFVNVYTKLSYQDTFGNLHTDYYYSPFYYSIATQLSNADGSQLFQLYSQRQHLSMQSSATDVLNYVKNMTPDF